MCWSGEASTVLAAIGLASTTYVALKGEDKRLWLPLGYFSLMEALQAYTYTVIDDCDNPNNQMATLLGYLHIVFQPFLINLISLYFVPKEVREKIEFWVFSLVLVGAFTMIVSIYPFAWAEQCNPAFAPFCGPRLCSIHGDWHIAWEMPRSLVGWPFGVRAYALTAFILPILYGSWRMTLYHFATGPLLAKLLTTSLNELAAVWCLFSIGLLLIVIKTPIRKYLYVKSWPLWRLIIRNPIS
jgi:Family of unknown function (DUF5765)